ncbi:unnamed protein product, partial [Musa textilis]
AIAGNGKHRPCEAVPAGDIALAGATYSLHTGPLPTATTAVQAQQGQQQLLPFLTTFRK